MVVLSLEMCDDFDSTTVEAIGEFATALRQRGCTLLFARLKDRPRRSLTAAGLADLPPDGATTTDRYFWSVDDAYRQALALVTDERHPSDTR